MNLAIEQQNGQDFLNILFNKSWRDSSFKDKLVKNPIFEIEKIIEKKFKLEKNLNLVVEDQTDDSIIYLNLPKNNVSSDDLVLTDEQLDFVSGGEGIVLATWATSYLIGVGIGLAAVGVAYLASKL